MIQTKSNEPDNQRLGFEAAIAKGKLYNPLSGKELLEFLLRHIKGMLAAAEPPVNIELINAIAAQTRLKIEKHPGLDSETLAYPKADLKIDIYITAIDATGKTAATIDILVTKAPQEEKRGFGIVVNVTNLPGEWDRIPLHLYSDFNLDSIPPDALRILNDLPVPTPSRMAGTGPSGETTIVDQDKPASEQQKAAVEKQFGSGNKPQTTKKEKK